MMGRRLPCGNGGGEHDMMCVVVVMGGIWWLSFILSAVLVVGG